MITLILKAIKKAQMIEKCLVAFDLHITKVTIIGI